MIIKWETIDEHENYQINRMGDVRNKRTGKILKPYDDGNGYLRVKLDGKSLRLHILVAKQFIPNDNPLVKNIVNHKKGNKHDPRASQLEWVTQQENVIHAWRCGLISRRGMKVRIRG